MKKFSFDTCETNKKMYQTESIAEEALITAWTAYSYKSNNGPIGVYLCDVCGTYHLTSKGEMNKKLAAYMASGALKKDQEAERWRLKLMKKK